MKKTKIIAITILVVIVLCVATALCFVSIPTGQTGILVAFGKAEDNTLQSGLHIKSPFKTVVKMSNQIQKNNVDTKCFSKDIQEVSMSLSINYQVKPQNTVHIYRTIGLKYFDTVIVPNVLESIKVETATYTAEQLLQNRQELANGIEKSLSERLSDYKIEIIGISIEDLDFSDAFTNAVEAKQVAQQNKLKAETEAQQKVIEAQAQADAKKIQVDAEAYATRTQAEAQAEANEKLSKSLTSEVLQYKFYEKWDGKLPTVSGSDMSLILPQIPAEK